MQDRGTQLTLAYRLAPGQWEDDVQFARVAALLTAQRGAADELILFDDIWPSSVYTPLEKVQRTAETARRRMATLRAQGWRSLGINVLYTLGHGNPVPDYLSAMPFQGMVGHDGQVSQDAACPNDLQYRAYIRQRYALMASARPDFIWVDDDFRMSHHGVLYPCFCPSCLARFGHGDDREALVAALNAPENGALRRAWSEFCAASLEGVCADIRQAVADVDPSIEMGLMTIGYSHSTYAGYPIKRWTQALGARRGRPGHGYYTDRVPRQLLNKALDVGRQVRDYPDEIRTIEYESENFPYITLDKAVRTVLNECAHALMMGCTGIAFNVLNLQAGPLDDYASLIAAIAAERPVWEALREGVRDLPLTGLWPADSPNLMANREVDERGWFWEGGLYDIQRPNVLLELGVPFATDPHQACGVVLAGKVAEAFSEHELRHMLGRAAWLDAAALRVLWARGLGELTGVRPGRDYPCGVCEQISAHPLNGPHAGDVRNAINGPQDGVCELVPLDAQVAQLAHLTRLDGGVCGCCLSLYTNALGGRVAVSSYVPWHALGRGAKRAQLLAVADWLAGGRLPVLIPQTVRVSPLVRQSTDGRKVCVVLLNTALEDTGPLTLRLRARPRQVWLVERTGKRLLPMQAGEGETIVQVPSMPAWQTHVLIGE